MTIPDTGDLVRAKVRWAARYVEIGWKVFVLGRDKTPLPNCYDCHGETWLHVREDCTCLTCHGFYAATSNLDAIEDMVTRHPDGWLAVRTGAASNLLVLDFEAAPNDQGVTGLDTLDQWEMWTGVELSPAATLRQRTQSGGLHLMFRLPRGVMVKSRNRILPQCDVKAEGGYVAVPTPGRPEREWLRPAVRSGDPTDDVRDVPPELLDALEKLRSGSRGRSGREHDALYGDRLPLDGYDYNRFLAEGCPGGVRDEFFNELLFRHRKAGVSLDGMERIARLHWERCQQPPATTWYMPWEHVMYKLERVWRTVEPNPPLPSWRPVPGAPVWMNLLDDAGKPVGEWQKLGNVAVTRSDW